MEISGKIIQALEEQSGNGRNGVWKKKDYIMETGGQYPKKVCLTVWGDKIDQFGMKEGEEVTASIEVESREYNSRWYTDVKVWKVTRSGAEGQNTSQQPDVTSFSEDNEGDILPF